MTLSLETLTLLSDLLNRSSLSVADPDFVETARVAAQAKSELAVAIVELTAKEVDDGG